MRKAKVAAIVFGGVSTCILGGLLGVYATAPIVSSVTPKNDVENVYEVESEILSNVAAVTSIRSTAVTTTSKKTTSTYSIYKTTTIAGDTANTTNKSEGVSADFYAKSPVIAENNNQAPVTEDPTDAPAPTEAPTEAPAPTIAEEPATEAPTEAPTEPTTETNAPVTEEPTTEPEQITTEPVTEPATEVQDPEDNNEDNSSEFTLPITDEEYILLCNAVAHEAGSYWISEYDKALVVEVIMNRVNSPRFGNTIYAVLTAPNQFSGAWSYVNLGYFSNKVTDSVKNAVTLYFRETDQFDHGYLYFHGDGRQNYFR